jgi:hypothetical protein
VHVIVLRFEEELSLQVIVVAVQSPVVTICTTRFDAQKSYVLPTQFVFMSCVDLRAN